MVRCRSKKCQEKYRKLINKIMLTVPEKYRHDYSKVRELAKPHITKKEWVEWRARQ
jgi:hypothetical protein